MAEANNGINFMALMNPNFAAQQQKFQIQQLLAQKMMEEGAQQPANNQLANPGGMVVQNSPLGAAARAAEKITGAYMQNKAMEGQIDAYKQLSASLRPQANGQALGEAINGNSPPDITRNPNWQLAAMLDPASASKALVDPMMQTSEQKNFADPAMHDLVKAEMTNKGLIEGGKDYINLPSPNSAPPVAATINSSDIPPPIMVNGRPQAPDNMDEILKEQTNVMPNPIPGITPGYDKNSSAAVTEAKASAQKRGEGAITEVQQQELGKKQVSGVIGDISKYYDDLGKSGGAVDPANNAIENVAAYTGNSRVGQEFGKMAGTKTQSIRNKIEQSRPLLINAIRKATGMSAKAMDSNTELQFYLKAATDPTLDIKANKTALKNLETIYGLGDGGPSAPNPITHSYVPGKGIVPVGGE